MMKPNSKAILNYLKDAKDVTVADVAEALGLDKRQVDGIFTSAIQCEGYGVRVPAEIKNADGSHTAVKFLRLTETGMALGSIKIHKLIAETMRRFGHPLGCASPVQASIC